SCVLHATASLAVRFASCQRKGARLPRRCYGREGRLATGQDVKDEVDGLDYLGGGSGRHDLHLNIVGRVQGCYLRSDTACDDAPGTRLAELLTPEPTIGEHLPKRAQSGVVFDFVNRGV